MIVYKLTNTKTKKSYIGQTINDLSKRVYNHVKSSQGKSNLGKIPWNKGLTKETDLRVNKIWKTRKLKIKNADSN